MIEFVKKILSDKHYIIKANFLASFWNFSHHLYKNK